MLQLSTAKGSIQIGEKKALLPSEEEEGSCACTQIDKDEESLATFLLLSHKDTIRSPYTLVSVERELSEPTPTSFGENGARLSALALDSRSREPGQF